MSVITKNPTANQTPDPGQGGSAVTGAINTGHGNTLVEAGGVQTKSCIWTGFQAAGGQIKSITLKADWSYTASIDGGSNIFGAEYSLDGGSTWVNVLFNHNNVNGINVTGSAQASLSVSQDISQVQVRDLLQASGGAAVLTGAISNIRLEVVTVDQVIVMM